MTKIMLKTLNEIKFWKLFREKPEWNEKELMEVMRIPNYIFAIYKIKKLEEKFQRKLFLIQDKNLKLVCNFELKEIYHKVWNLKIK